MKSLYTSIALIACISTSNAQSFFFHQYSTNGGVNINDARGFAQNSDSTLFIALYGNGVTEYNWKNNTWKNHKEGFGKNYWLGNFSFGVAVDKGDTIYAVNSKRTSVYADSAWVSPPSGLMKGSQITSDKNGAIWLAKGSSTPQIQKYYNGKITNWNDSVLPQLMGASIHKLTSDNDGSLWLSTEEGLMKFDGTNLTKEAFFNDTVVESTYFDHNGTQWACGDYWFAKKDNGIWKIFDQNNWIGSTGRNGDITQTKSGYTFITSGWRLYIIDPLDSVKEYSYKDSTTQMPSNANYFPRLYTDTRDHVWMSIYQGAGVIEIQLDSVIEPNPNPNFIKQVVSSNELQIYPNPAIHEITIATNILGESAYLEIIDLEGKIILEKPINPLNYKVPINNIQKGIYLVSLYNQKKIVSKKLIIE